MTAIALSVRLPAVVATVTSDAELISATLDGDRSAFTKLVRRLDPSLRGLVTGLLRGSTSVDDVLQETYLKAFRSLGSYRSGSVKAWFARIAYTTAIDEIRRSKRLISVDPSISETNLEPEPNIDIAIVRRTELIAALADLSERQRAVVVLVDGHGYNYADVGQTLQIPEGTVGFHLHNARKALRLALNDLEEDDV